MHVHNINLLHSCAVCVTIFSTDGEIPPGFEFYIAHALSQVARSYALLVQYKHAFAY